MNSWHLIGVGLIGTGALYLRNPNIYRRGLWLKTSIAIRMLSPEQYKMYIRVLGALLIFAGLASLAYGFMA